METESLLAALLLLIESAQTPAASPLFIALMPGAVSCRPAVERQQPRDLESSLIARVPRAIVYTVGLYGLGIHRVMELARGIGDFHQLTVIFDI
jgi:hypothetical protein